MDPENEKGRVIYKIVDGLVLAYLNRRQYIQATNGLVNDSMWLRNRNPEMPIVVDPKLHDKSLEDIIELFFHYGRFDIPADFMYMEQQLRQISNQFTDCLVNLSQNNKRKMEERHNRFLLMQRTNRLAETPGIIAERNERLGQPVTNVPSMLQSRIGHTSERANKRKQQDEYVFPATQMTARSDYPPAAVNCPVEDVDPPSSIDLQETPGAGEKVVDDLNTSFEAGSNRRKSKPHNVKNDIKTIVNFATNQAQQRLNKEVQRDNWDLGDEFESLWGQLPPDGDICGQLMLEVFDQFNSPIPACFSKSINSQSEPTIPVKNAEIIKKVPSQSDEVNRLLPSPSFSPIADTPKNAFMEDLFGKEDGECTRSAGKSKEQFQHNKRREKPIIREEHVNKGKRNLTELVTSLEERRPRIQSTSSTSSCTSKSEEICHQKVNNVSRSPRVESAREKAKDHEKRSKEKEEEEERARERQKEHERIENEKQKERQRDREKMEKEKEVRRTRQEKEKERMLDREKGRERLRDKDPRRQVESYAAPKRRDSRNNSSASSTTSENDKTRDRDYNRNKTSSRIQVRNNEKPSTSSARRSSRSPERRDKKEMKISRKEDRKSDTPVRSQNRDKESKHSGKLKDPGRQLNTDAEALFKTTTDDIFAAIGDSIDASLAPPAVAPLVLKPKAPPDMYDQLFPGATKFHNTIKIPKMKILGEKEIAKEVATLEERENTPEKLPPLCIGFPTPNAINLIPKCTMSDARLGMVLTNVTKKREQLRADGVVLEDFDPDRNVKEFQEKKHSSEEIFAPFETTQTLQNEQPPVKKRKKIDPELAEKVLSKIHGV